jgi:hypothetical protein
MTRDEFITKICNGGDDRLEALRYLAQRWYDKWNYCDLEQFLIDWHTGGAPGFAPFHIHDADTLIQIADETIDKDDWSPPDLDTTTEQEVDNTHVHPSAHDDEHPVTTAVIAMAIVEYQDDDPNHDIEIGDQVEKDERGYWVNARLLVPISDPRTFLGKHAE